MAASTFRKAIGVVKDQTSISLAKVAGNVAPDLEVLVVKATSHDNELADKKHIREILSLMSYSRGYVSACVALISKRLSKTHDWIVAVKALMLAHRLLNDGDPAFGQEIMCAMSRRGMRILNMSDFRDEAHSNSWDHSGFVKSYALYLDEKFELLAYERKLNGMGEKRVENGFGEFKEGPSYGTNRTSWAYGDFDESEVKGENLGVTPVREMKPERVLERLNQLLQILNRFLACKPTGAAKNSRIVLVALYSMVKDSFILYADICEALEFLLDQFKELEYTECVKAFDAYVNAAKLIEELGSFYNWCDNIGIARSSEFPEVQQITDNLLGTLEGFLRERANKSTNSKISKMERLTEFKEEEVPNMNEIRALPPPENFTPTPPPRAGPHQLKPQTPKVTGELVNLKDDGITADDQGNKMALALFSGPLVTKTNESWEEFPTDGVTSAWQTPAAEIGKPNWELALAESSSNLSKQKADLAGGFDPLLLNGMYDQGAVRQHASNTQLSGGSASSVALPCAGKNSTPFLALPAPDGTVQPVGPHDPFAASLLVPPPSYVQMADIEKKQHLLMQEQQLWQQYTNNGMRGQTGLAKITGNAGYYGAGMHQVTGLEQPAYYFTPL